MKKTSISEPFIKFANWFEQAQAKTEIIEPTAMCLATVDEKNRPSSRMVLLKKFDERGFCFLSFVVIGCLFVLFYGRELVTLDKISEDKVFGSFLNNNHFDTLLSILTKQNWFVPTSTQHCLEWSRKPESAHPISLRKQLPPWQT